MESDTSFETGERALGLRLSVEERTVFSGVGVPNPLAAVDVAKFGLGVKVGAKGLSDFGDVSETKSDFLAAPKGNPFTWGGCGERGVNVVDWGPACVGTKGGKDETDEDVEKPAGVLGASNTCI
jgi:hypothetical protein